SPRPRSSAPGTAPGTVTVAELIARCSGMPVPPRRTTGPEGAVSVAALLRREGRGPRVADRPLVPRGHAPVASPPPPPPRRNGRKVVVAAGALFAATAVFGPSVVEDAAGPSVGAGDAGVPLPDAGAQVHAWTVGAGDDGLVLAATRQLFAAGIPSELDAAPVDTAPVDAGPVDAASPAGLGPSPAARLAPAAADPAAAAPAVTPAVAPAVA